MFDRTEILNCLPTRMDGPYHCMVCLTPVRGWKPEICCGLSDCDCLNLPLEPCYCTNHQPRSTT